MNRNGVWIPVAVLAEDLAPQGLTGKALRAGGAQEGRWAAVEAAHLGKIKQVMKLARNQGKLDGT